MNPARLALFVTVLLGSVLLAQQPSAPAKPSKEQIARWVAQLGDDDFNVREQASQKLWEAGEAAEPALQAALKGGDAEVARRAQEVLDRFKWGLYPNTPRELVALINRYQQAEGDGKTEVVRELLEAGTGGCKTLLKILAAESVPENQKAVRNQLAVDLPRALPRLLADKEPAPLDQLLNAGMEAEAQLGLRNAVACWLLTGQIDRKIEQMKVRAPARENGKEAELLVLLLRARGDLAAARDTARQAEREDLVLAMLYEVGDWKEDSWPREIAGPGRDIEKLGYRAACRRLAGQQKEFEEVLAEIRKRAEEVQGNNDKELFQLAKVLLLNHQIKDGLAVLARSETRTADLFEILKGQHRYAEALDLVEKIKEPPFQLELRQAGLLGRLGEKDRARAIFARGAEQAARGTVSSAQLLEAEMEAGLIEDAFKHAAQMQAQVRDDRRRGPEQEFGKLFPQHGPTAQALWGMLARLFPNEGVEARMNRLRQLMTGNAPRQDVAALIEKAGALDNWLPLAEAALTCRQEDLARQCLEKDSSPQALLMQGDLLACNKKWDEAARLYFQVWQKEHDPLALYLSGKALLRAGQRPEGQRRVELARLLPLGNEQVRQTLASGLAKRGDRSGALREYDLLFRLGAPGSYQAAAAMSQAAMYAHQLRQTALAGEYYERYTLRSLGATYNFLSPQAYFKLPGFICGERIPTLLAVGKVEEALQLLARAEEVWPGHSSLAVVAVPELEKQGRKKEAAELFARTIELHQKVLRQFPRCADAHNSIAWTAVGCKRNLDAALEHAQKAVELEPESTSYLDTLAEVYFQRGDQTRAVELQKKVVQKTPYRAHYRQQLKRIEAGDPTVPTLPQIVAPDSGGQPLPFAEDDGD